MWGLLFVLPRGRRRHFFPLYTHFRAGMAQSYGSKESFSMFASHSRWDGDEVRKLVPNAFSLTILRDPVDSFESRYGYSHQEKVLGISLTDFIQRLADGDTRDGTGTGGRNRMLWDLGIDRRDMHDDV